MAFKVGDEEQASACVKDLKSNMIHRHHLKGNVLLISTLFDQQNSILSE